MILLKLLHARTPMIHVTLVLLSSLAVSGLKRWQWISTTMYKST